MVNDKIDLDSKTQNLLSSKQYCSTKSSHLVSNNAQMWEVLVLETLYSDIRE